MIPCLAKYSVPCTDGNDHTADTSPNFYAFVKFYSALAAAQAKNELAGRLFLKGQHLKVCIGYLASYHAN